MTNILKLQAMTIEGVEEPSGVLGASSQSNACGNNNSSASWKCNGAF